MGQVFRRAEQYLDQFDPEYMGQFVEIGTSRNGDDGSTRTIASWAARFGKALVTVDMDINNCNYVVEQDIPNVEVICQRGEEYLKHFPRHIAYISLLYLDNFDWDWHPEQTAKGPNIVIGPNHKPVIGLPENSIFEQHQRYNELGMPEMNNVNSQRAHLRQAELALPAMADKCLVICDDTWYNKWWGHYSGKSGAVVPYLLNHGFEVIYTEEDPVYGTILGRGITK
jgi:hypothetical protein